MVAEWQLDMSPTEYLDAFTNWPGGVLDGALELVTEVREVVPTGCLSNTNSIHWNAHFAQWALMSGFDHRFLSFEIGAVKPDQELFQFVANAIGASPERTLFLDDNVLNIDGALSFGFQARRVKGVPEARQALTDLGVISA
jgi:putative hydrolase of the HAD superfamily